MLGLTTHTCPASAMVLSILNTRIYQSHGRQCNRSRTWSWRNTTISCVKSSIFIYENYLLIRAISIYVSYFYSVFI